MKLKHTIPFCGLMIILVASYCLNLHDRSPFSTKFMVGASLLLLNSVLYFLRQPVAIILTGLVLILGLANLISLARVEILTSYFVRIGGLELATPLINWIYISLFLLYILLNGRFVVAFFRNLTRKSND